MKKVIFLGSSVTYGDNGWSMCEYISENMGCEMVKWAVSGTTLADISEEAYVNRLDRQIDTESRCDCFVCQLSTNDANWNLPIGDVGTSRNKADFDRKTIMGAVEYIIASVTEKWNCPVVFYTGTYMNNSKYQEMVDALIKLREKWGFEIIDLWNNPEMRAVDKQTYDRYMKDPVHPKKLGYIEWWGPEFVKVLKKYL